MEVKRPLYVMHLEEFLDMLIGGVLSYRGKSVSAHHVIDGGHYCQHLLQDGGHVSG